MIKKIIFPILFLSCIAHGFCAVVPLGEGGYLDEIPPEYKGPSNRLGSAVYPKTDASMVLPPKTNQWWSSIIWQYHPENPWSENLFALPLSFKAKRTGLGVGYSNKAFVDPEILQPKGHKTQEYHFHYLEDFVVGTRGLDAEKTTVADYGDWTVTAAWKGGAGSIEATIGHGLPFTYFTSVVGIAEIRANADLDVWHQENNSLAFTLNGHHYVIFGPLGSNWTVEGRLIFSELGGKDYFSLALLSERSLEALEIFQQHAFSFVTGSQVFWEYDVESSEILATFTLNTIEKEPVSDGTTLQALFRHQWQYLEDSLSLNHSYVSPRGEMKLIEGNIFRCRFPFSGVLPELPFVVPDGSDSNFSREKMERFLNDIYLQSPTERWNQLTLGDTYWFGKALGKITRLVHIADQLGNQEAFDLFLQELKAHVVDWLDGEKPHVYAYDQNWHTLIGFPPSYGSNTELNDHHFHYGYLIMAAACIAQYDPAWEKDYGEMIRLIIKDPANWERNDFRFPFLRNYDVYAGHGWANGAQLFAAGNNQESSSESMNFSTSLILWGEATQDPAIRDLGMFLYANEAQAIEQYWFDVDDQVFPEGFEKPALGILWGNGGSYTIFWDGYIEELHGINFLPITGGSLYLSRNPDYLRQNQMIMHSSPGSNSMAWLDIHLGVQALYDPLEAAFSFSQHEDYIPEAGDSKAHTYYWIHNLASLGSVNHDIHASIPTAVVFSKEGINTYVAYNGRPTPETVQFSDNFSAVVGPRQMEVLTEESSPSPLEYIQSHAFQSEGIAEASIVFSAPVEDVWITYQKNSGERVQMRPTFTGNSYTYVFEPLDDGDLIKFNFIFTHDGQVYHVEEEVILYNAQSNCVDVIEEEDYSVRIGPISDGIASFVFQGKKNFNFVDIHYVIDGFQQDFRLSALEERIWSFNINNLSEGEVITYWFTYGDTVAMDTPKREYIFSTSCNQEVESKFTSGVLENHQNGLLFLISFEDHPEEVFLNYKTNESAWEKVPMAEGNRFWEAAVSDIGKGDLVIFYFSYRKQTEEFTTPWSSHTVSDTASSKCLVQLP
jgi:endoglucanase Acf2